MPKWAPKVDKCKKTYKMSASVQEEVKEAEEAEEYRRNQNITSVISCVGLCAMIPVILVCLYIYVSFFIELVKSYRL